MHSIPNARHGRLFHPEKNAFWNWDLNGKTLTAISGKIGQKGRETSKTHPTEEKALDDLESKHYKKLRDGFRIVDCENLDPGGICLQFWLTGNYTGFMSLDISPDGKQVVACRHSGQGNEKAEIILTDTSTGDRIKEFQIEEFDLSSIRFYGDDLIIQADDRVSQLDIGSEQATSIGSGGVFPHLGFDLQSGRLLLSRAGSTGATIVVLNVLTGELLLEIDASEQQHVTDHRITHVGALSPSGNLAAISRRPGEIELYNLVDQTHSVIQGAFPAVASMQFHPSENWLGFCEKYGDWRFRLWSLQEMKEDNRVDALEYTFPDGSPRSSRECFDFCFCPTGQALAIRDGSWLRILDFDTCSEILRIEQRHVIKTTGTSGFVLRFGEDNRIITRTDRGVITIYNSPLKD